MKKKIKEADVLKRISKILGVSSSKIQKIDNISKIENWDSLQHLNIISSLDKLFYGKLQNMTDLSGQISIKKILKVLKHKKLIS